jgi:hypothetical protein
VETRTGLILTGTENGTGLILIEKRTKEVLPAKKLNLPCFLSCPVFFPLQLSYALFTSSHN